MESVHGGHFDDLSDAQRAIAELVRGKIHRILFHLAHVATSLLTSCDSSELKVPGLPVSCLTFCASCFILPLMGKILAAAKGVVAKETPKAIANRCHWTKPRSAVAVQDSSGDKELLRLR